MNPLKHVALSWPRVGTMRISLLTGFYPPPYNANSVRAMYMVKALKRKGFEVMVIPLLGTRNEKGFFGEKIHSPINIHCATAIFYERLSIARRLLDLLNKHVRLKDKILNKIAEFKADAIIATIPPVEAVPIASFVAEKLKLRLVIDVQDLADDYRVLERPWLAPAIRIYFKRIYKILKHADVVITTTEFMAKELEKRVGRKDFLLVPNGVDASFYKPCYKYRITTRPRDIAVFLGDLNFKYHKLDIFLQSMKVLFEKNRKIRLRVLGAGRELPKLKHLAQKLNIQNYVEFLGYVPRENMHKLLGTATFAIAGRPSIQNPWIINTMRLTIYEYLSCGLPILAYGPPNSYTQRFIEEHGIGVYVPSNDSKDVGEAVIRLIEEIERNPQIVTRCRKVAEQYDWHNVMSVFVSKMKEVLRGLENAIC